MKDEKTCNVLMKDDCLLKTASVFLTAILTAENLWVGVQGINTCAVQIAENLVEDKWRMKKKCDSVGVCTLIFSTTVTLLQRHFSSSCQNLCTQCI